MRNISSTRALVVVLLALLLPAIPLAAACSKPPPAQSPVPATKASPTQPTEAPKPAAPPKAVPPSPPAEQLQKALHIGTGPAGPSKTIGTALGTLVNRYTGMQATIELASGMTAYPPLNAGEIDVLPFSLPMPMRAYQGTGVEKTRLRDLSAAKYPAITSMVMVTRLDTGIKQIKDLRGKKVAHTVVLPYLEPMLIAALKVNGMKQSDVTWLGVGSTGEGAAAVKEKRADVMMDVLGSVTEELQKTVGALYIPFSPAEQAAMVEAEAGFVPFTAPKGFWGLDVDTPLVVAPFHIVSRAALNDATAYAVVKTLYDHIAEFQQIASILSGFTKEGAVSNLVLPFHPGAIRYYKEAGVWTAQHEARQQELLAAEKKLYGN